MNDVAPHLRMLQLLQGMWLARCVQVAAELGIPDRLADGERGARELAAETGVSTDRLYRLLKCLAANGVLGESGGLFRNTPVSSVLRSRPGSMRDLARLYGRPWQSDAWKYAGEALRGERSAFAHAHGTGIWPFLSLSLDEQALYDSALDGLAGLILPALIDAYDFSAFHHVVDVGGGTGAFLRALLERYPKMRGTLYERAEVLERMNGTAGAARLVSRAGDFFEGVPGDADAYILKQVLHDWDDDAAIEILRRCRAAMNDKTTLVTYEVLLPPDDSPQAALARLTDMHVMVLHGGRERTAAEMESLFATAGLSIREMRATGTPLVLIDAASS